MTESVITFPPLFSEPAWVGPHGIVLSRPQLQSSLGFGLKILNRIGIA